MKKILSILTILLFAITLISTNYSKEIEASELNEINMTGNAEFRAAWISYYTGDIYFDTVKQYKESIDKILNVLEFYNFNAMIFHIRANHDAWYKSEINRTNAQLVGLDFDEFDPLEYVITEAHKRGIEFHAWMNPYRIGSTYKTAEGVAEAFKIYPNNPASKVENVLAGSTLQILDPGIPENRDFIVETCMEVVENYDVDAIHFDDYFYASGIDDSATRTKYNTTGLSTSDFRRQQVDTFIYNLKCSLDEFNAENNRYVQLGISPTGVYQNASSQSEANTPLSEYQYNANGDLIYPKGATIGCQNHYESYLYCDTLKWVNNEWINYILPQTYWARNHSRAPYEKLINWWNMAVKNKNVNLYSGMGLYMWTSTTNEASAQIEIARGLEYVKGTSVYSFGEVMDGYNGSNTAARGQMAIVKYKHWNSKMFAPKVTGFDELELGSVQNFKQYENTISFTKVDGARFYVIYRTENEFTYDSSEIVDIIGSDSSFITWTDTVSGDYKYNVIPLSYTNTLGKPIKPYEQVEEGNITFSLYSDSSLSNKYNATNVLNLEYGNEVYLKLEEEGVSSNLSDYIWKVDKEDVLNVDEKGNINILKEGSANIIGRLKTDETKIVKFTINVYSGDIINKEFNVKFFDYDGTLLKEEKVKYGQSATPPTGLYIEPTIEFKYEFLGWNEIYTNITSDIDIHAVYSVSLHVFTVTFKNPDGTIIEEKQVPYGTAAIEPENPTMAPTVEYTYIFEGWDKEFSNITSDLVVTAVYFSSENMYKMEYKTNGGSRVSSEFYYYYENVYSPSKPKKDGYEFGGWFYDEELTEQCVFPIKLVKDTTVYAKWLEKLTVNYYDLNNEIIKTDTVLTDGVLTNIPTLSVEGKIFKGWSIDKETLVDLTLPVTTNLDLYPLFENLLKVTYYDYHNNVIESIEILNNSKIENILDYNLNGYVFAGWSINKENIFDFNKNITEDLNLYPVLKKILKIYYYDFEYNELKIVEVVEGSKLTNDVAYSEEGFKFIGWSKDEKTLFDFDTIITEEFDLYPIMEEIIIEDDEDLIPEPTPDTPKNCKCNKDAGMMLINSLLLASIVVLLLKKKRS